MALPDSDLARHWWVTPSLLHPVQPLVRWIRAVALVPLFVPLFVAFAPTQDHPLAEWSGLRSPAVAHTVKVSGEVAVTFHLEPNHNPRAGVPSLTWFVLTRKGGALIPLSQCNCQVVVYTLPRAKNARPLLRPALQAVNVEGYQGLPGTQIVFPKAGQYEIVISGSPKPSASFKPFSINYSVVVSRGK